MVIKPWLRGRLAIIGLVVVIGLSGVFCNPWKTVPATDPTARTAESLRPDDMSKNLVMDAESAPILNATPIPEPTPTPTPTPQAIFDPTKMLMEVGQEMRALSSFHFRLSHEKGSTEISKGLYIEDVEGHVVNPDKMAMEFQGTFDKRLVIRSRLIIHGDRVYMTNPLSGKWEDLSEGINPFEFFSPSKGIVSLMVQAKDMKLLGVVAGGGAYRLEGTLPTSALSVLLGDTLPSGSVACELTVEIDAMLLKEARIVGKVTSSDQEEFVRVITLSAFNEPVSIEVPRLE